MRILLITQYFYPETGATSNRVLYLAKYLQEKGHDVRVIAEKPNHPRGIFFEGFEEGMFLDRTYEGIPVTYCWVYTRPEKGFWGRIFFYLSFMFMAMLAAARLKGRYDIVWATSPPLFVGISGWAASLFRRARFVFDVRDLWPDVAVAMGELGNDLAIGIAQYIEKFLYRRADLITPVTHSFREAIVSKGISGDKITVVMNGTDTSLFNLEIPVGKLRENLGFQNRFIASYVGNLGLAQGLEHILEAARELQDRKNLDISFLIVGDGPKKSNLRELSETYNLSNLTFIPRVPLEEAVRYMMASDCLLVPLARDDIYDQFIPSKLFDGMAAAKPILLSVDGESRNILRQAGAGLYYEAENHRQLVEKLLWLKDHPQKIAEMGRQGRKYVEEHMTREAQSNKMMLEFKQLIA